MELNEAINQYGLTAFVTLFVGVIAFLYKQNLKLQDKYIDEKDKRLQDAITARDKIVEPLSQQIEMSKKIYDLLSVFNSRGK